MTQNELIVMRDLLGDIIEANESLKVARVEHNDAKALHDEIHRLEDKLAYLAKEKSEYYNSGVAAAVERDEARRRLKDAVLMLEDMWRDYSQIKWHSKADKKRAADMAAKIKAWSDEKEFHMVQTDKGEWVAK